MYIRVLKTNRTVKGFNVLASVYSKLGYFIFGNSLQKAQLHFFSHIRPTDNVLILGGGDGIFLKALLAAHPNLHIDYIDISPRMTALAKQKAPPGSHVNFIVGTEKDIPNTQYAVVITNFYLDLFSDKTLKTIIEKIQRHLHPDARWLATDFVNEKWWHHIMLWLMYRFFRITAGIEAELLPDWQRCLTTEIEEKTIHKKFYGGFVITTIFYR